MVLFVADAPVDCGLSDNAVPVDGSSSFRDSEYRHSELMLAHVILCISTLFKDVTALLAVACVGTWNIRILAEKKSKSFSFTVPSETSQTWEGGSRGTACDVPATPVGGCKAGLCISLGGKAYGNEVLHECTCVERACTDVWSLTAPDQRRTE